MRKIGSAIFAVLILAWLPCADARAQEPRIVTIGGAVTEIVFALGHGDRVVAIDLTSTFPPAARSRPSVGYMRALSAEGVMSLAPTLIIATEGSGPPDVISILSHAAVRFETVPEGHDEKSVVEKVRRIAAILGERERGEAMVRALTEDFRLLAELRAAITKPRKGIFVLAVGSGTPTIGGGGTSADGIMHLAGLQNAMSGMKGFKPAVAESTLAAAPEFVLTMYERNHGLDADTMFSLPAFSGTPAARDRRLIPVPSYYLSFSPRTAHAAARLAAAVYPELKLEEPPPRPWTAKE